MEDPLYSTFLVIGDFDDQMVEDFYSFCCDLNSCSQATLYINSTGGEIAALNSMINLMHCTDVQWVSVAIGNVHSAALDLYVQADQRFSAPNALFMFHSTRTDLEGSIESIEADLKMLKEMATAATVAFSKRTKQTSAWWNKQALAARNGEFYFKPTAAKRYGVVDKIKLPKVFAKDC